ncbi:hypothetical protein BAE44_0024272, partial [Dichanthelium oligosanthes]
LSNISASPDNRLYVQRLFKKSRFSEKRLQTGADHPFSGCCYTRQIWHAVFTVLNFRSQQPATNVSTLDWWLELRSGLNKIQKSGLDSAFMLISWTIWKERNARVFDNKPETSAAELIRGIVAEGQLWIRAGAKYLVADGRQWQRTMLLSSLV